MDTVLSIGVKPSEVVLQGIVQGSLPTIEKGCCTCLQGHTFSRGVQGVAIVCAIGAIIVIGLLYVPGAVADPKAFYASIALVVMSVGLIGSVQRNINLGGYAEQNGIYQRNNEFMKRQIEGLAVEVDRLDPITKSLANTNSALQIEVIDIKRAAEQFEASLAESHRVNNEMSTQVERLKQVQNGLNGALTTLVGTTDAAQAYIDKEVALQREQAKLQEHEAALLERLDGDIQRVEQALKEKKEKCLMLAKRVVPLKIEVVRLTRMIDFVGNRNSSLVEEAKLSVRKNLLSKKSG